MLVRRYRNMETIKQFVVDSTNSSKREYVEESENLDKLSSLIRFPLRGLEDIIDDMSEIDEDFCCFKRSSGIDSSSRKCETMRMYSRAAYILAERLSEAIQVYLSPGERKSLGNYILDSHVNGTSCDYRKEIESLRRVASMGRNALAAQRGLKAKLNMWGIRFY